MRDMWRNYLTTGYRALTRNKTFAAINLLGLAMGLAACLALLLYVRYETSYDAWLPDAERVYQLQSHGADPETGEPIYTQGVTQPVAPALAKDFPEIEAVSRLESDDPLVRRSGETVKVEKGKLADTRLFEVLALDFLAGDPREALKASDSLVLSRSEAMRWFGTAEALGRTLTLIDGGEQAEYRVTGVYEDLPKNSHMDFTFVRRMDPAGEAGCSWGCVSGTTYVKLRPGASDDAIHARMPAWEKRNVPPRDIGGGDIARNFDWKLVPVRDVHLGRAQDGDRPGNDLSTIVTFAIIALLILAMACVNFVNLATARASRRAREVAVRKVLGARRAQLVVQFLGESLAVAGLAMVIALALLEVALPAFSAFLGADLRLAYFGVDGLLWPVAGLILAVGLAGGLYPAFHLSRFQPAAVLKANKSADADGTGSLRNLLVVAQFAVSIGLIVCTAIVYQQTSFARTADPGFRAEGVLMVDGTLEGPVVPRREAIEREIARIDGVSGVAGTMIVPGSDRTYYTSVSVPGRADAVKLGWYGVAPAFFGTMGIDMVAGRPLSAAHARDRAFVNYWGDEAAIAPAEQAIAARGINIVLNEAGAKRLGFATAAAAIGKPVSMPAFGPEVGPVPATIVGVAEDSRFRSVRETVEPLAYYDTGYYRALAVRFEGDPAAVRARIAEVWRRHVPDAPFEAEFVDSSLAALYGADEARGQTFGGFAFLAILIACLGLFGLAAFTAERRTKEIGIRKVFGARVRDIVALLAWQFSKPVVLANLIAWPAAWWVMRDWLNGFDARVALTPGPFLLAGFVALAIALGTIAGHAMRVARMNPIHALRYE